MQNIEEYHLLGHCTEKTTAESSLELWKDVFDLFGLDLMLINSGCCGMAGTYGHETEHYEESLGIYNLSWRKKFQMIHFIGKKYWLQVFPAAVRLCVLMDFAHFIQCRLC